MLAKDVMETNVISLKKDTSIKEIAALMIKHSISGFPVVSENNTVLGVVSELDLMRKEIRPNEPNVWTVCIWGLNNSNKLAEYEDSVRKYMAETAGDIMTSPAITVDEMDDLETVGNLMFDKSIKRVFVTRKGALAGVISRSAFVKLLLSPKNN
jgi:CBS domain-containing protein